MSLSAVIVDDEQLARDELAFLLKNVGDINVVAQGKNGVEAVNLIREHSPDLVFLDVQLPGLDGFGVLKKLVNAKITLPQIVFATAYDQYSLKAFEVNAVDYLLKPFDKKRVAQSVQRARKNLEISEAPAAREGKPESAATGERIDSILKMLESQQSPRQKVVLRTGGRMILIDQREI